MKVKSGLIDGYRNHGATPRHPGEAGNDLTAQLRKPDAGPVIKGSGGLRKLRWAAHDVGKSGGLRVIYYWHRQRSCIFLITAYRKNEVASLTSAELRVLKALVDDIERDFGDSDDGEQT